MDSPTGLESLIAGVSNNKEHKKSAHCRGGGGGMSVTDGRKVCIGVLSSDEIGLCGIEHDWVSTAVSVEENCKGELSYRRKNAGGKKCVLLGESADGACVSCMN